MRYYGINADQVAGMYDGEFQPYPDLGDLILTKKEFPHICVEIRKGKYSGDMLFAAFNVVSPRFVEVLESCDATGYRAMPIPLTRHGKVVDNFYLIKLLGKGGQFDEAKSKARRSPNGDAIWDYHGVYMDESAWDGSDVFAIPGLGIGMYVVERVAAAIEQAKLVNTVITRNDFLKGALSRGD